MNGQGRYVFAKDGSSYEGEFLDGRMNGYGIYIDKDGGRFEGYYQQGRKHGMGTYVYHNGATYEGEWAYDKKVRTHIAWVWLFRCCIGLKIPDIQRSFCTFSSGASSSTAKASSPSRTETCTLAISWTTSSAAAESSAPRRATCKS